MAKNDYCLTQEQIMEFLKKHNLEAIIEHPVGKFVLSDTENQMKGFHLVDNEIKYENDKIVIVSSYTADRTAHGVYSYREVRTLEVNKQDPLNKSFNVKKENYQYLDGRLIDYSLECMTPTISKTNGVVIKVVDGFTYVQKPGREGSGVSATVREKFFDEHGIQISTNSITSRKDKLIVGTMWDQKEATEARPGTVEAFERLANEKGYGVSEHIESSTYRIWPDVIVSDGNIVRNGQTNQPERFTYYASLREGIQRFGANNALSEQEYKDYYSERTMEEIERALKENHCSQIEREVYQIYINRMKEHIVTPEQKSAMKR
jgi:hypothetical protein